MFFNTLLSKLVLREVFSFFDKKHKPRRSSAAKHTCIRLIIRLLALWLSKVHLADNQPNTIYTRSIAK
jgi:hypothetical protein